MTIARRVAEVHGGRIELSATSGERGLTVTLVIPQPVEEASSEKDQGRDTMQAPARLDQAG